MGLSGRVPPRVDAATKAGLLGLRDDAVEQGWSLRRASRTLELGEVQLHQHPLADAAAQTAKLSAFGEEQTFDGLFHRAVTCSRVFCKRAGTPAMIEPAGKLFVTTAPAPTTQ